jgi:Putative Flp pilus-assembly TadE/G-like
MKRRLYGQRGQALVITALLITALLGMATLVLDVGSWMRDQRDLQRVADAAALAGAQALPGSTSEASSLATAYASKNGGFTLDSLTFSGKLVANDTISVHLSKDAPGFFAKIFGIDSVHVGAKASARTEGVNAVRWVAPIAVNEKHPMLDPTCSPYPCRDLTRIDLIDLHKPGSGDASAAFALLNLNKGDSSGSIGDSTLADWMNRGFDRYMDRGTYYSVPSAKFNGSDFCSSLEAHIGDVVLFPVYREPIVESGSNAEFNIVGWAAFLITAVDCRGSKGWVEGRFQEFIAEGIQAESLSDPQFGVRSIELIE